MKTINLCLVALIIGCGSKSHEKNKDAQEVEETQVLETLIETKEIIETGEEKTIEIMGEEVEEKEVKYEVEAIDIIEVEDVQDQLELWEVEEESSVEQKPKFQKLSIGEKNNLYGIACLSKGAIVVGEKGVIYKVNITGTQKSASPTKNTLRTVAFLDDMKGFSAGDDSAFISTADGGGSWSDVGFCMAIPMGNYYDFHLLSEKAMFVSGISFAGDGTFKYNKGMGWTCYTNKTWPNSPLFATYWFDESHGFVTGETQGKLFRTDDFSAWSEIDTAHPNTFYDLHFMNKSEGLLVGSSGLILRTNNQGNQWKKIESNVVFDLYSIANNGNRILVVGRQGTLLESLDYGKSFYKCETEIGIDLTSVCISQEGRAYISGEDGIVLVEIL